MQFLTNFFAAIRYLKLQHRFQGVKHPVAYARGVGVKNPPFGDGTGSEDLSFYFNDPLLLRTELAEIANMSLLFNSPV